MEIVTLISDQRLNTRVQSVLRTELTYRKGVLFSVHPIPTKSLQAFIDAPHSQDSYLLILQTNCSLELLDRCAELQEKVPNAHFILLGRGDRDCYLAVRRHLLIADYIYENDQNLEVELARSLDRLSRQVYALRGGLFVRRDEEFILLPLSDIYYIEAIKRTHRCAVVTASGESQLRQNIRDLIHCLDARFYLCSASTIANLSNVRSIDPVQRTLSFAPNIMCGYSKRAGPQLKKILSGYHPQTTNKAGSAGSGLEGKTAAAECALSHPTGKAHGGRHPTEI